MPNGLVGVTMADTIDFFNLFHIALVQGGAWELLYTMLFTALTMIAMALVLEKLQIMLRRSR